MVTRVSEFVAAMNDLSSKSDTTASMMEQHVGTFNAVTGKALRELERTCGQFTPTAARSPKRWICSTRATAATENWSSTRASSIETLVATLDSRTDDFAQRLQRFSGLLDELLDAATSRREQIAGDHRRNQQRQRADHRASVRTGAHHFGGRAQAHRRNAERRLRGGRRRRIRCSTNPPTASPRSCRA